MEDRMNLLLLLMM